jgi:hypothetical protein
MQAAVRGEGLASSVAGRRHLCCFVNNKLDLFSEDHRPSIINHPISNKPIQLTTKQQLDFGSSDYNHGCSVTRVPFRGHLGQ